MKQQPASEMVSSIKTALFSGPTAQFDVCRPRAINTTKEWQYITSNIKGEMFGIVTLLV